MDLIHFLLSITLAHRFLNNTVACVIVRELFWFCEINHSRTVVTVVHKVRDFLPVAPKESRLGFPPPLKVSPNFGLPTRVVLRRPTAKDRYLSHRFVAGFSVKFSYPDPRT